MPIDFNKEDLKPQGLARNLANGKRISGSSAGSRSGTISAKSQAGDATKTELIDAIILLSFKICVDYLTKIPRSQKSEDDGRLAISISV